MKRILIIAFLFAFHFLNAGMVIPETAIHNYLKKVGDGGTYSRDDLSRMFAITGVALNVDEGSVHMLISTLSKGSGVPVSSVDKGKFRDSGIGNLSDLFPEGLDLSRDPGEEPRELRVVTEKWKRSLKNRIQILERGNMFAIIFRVKKGIAEPVAVLDHSQLLVRRTEYRVNQDGAQGPVSK